MRGQRGPKARKKRQKVRGNKPNLKPTTQGKVENEVNVKRRSLKTPKQDGGGEEAFPCGGGVVKGSPKESGGGVKETFCENASSAGKGGQGLVRTQDEGRTVQRPGLWSRNERDSEVQVRRWH